MDQETLTHAWEVLQDAYQAQMEGDYDRAVELYHSSLSLHPTAEAHTFLGWTYHFQGKLEDAIAECRRAIEIDPDGAAALSDGVFELALEVIRPAKECVRFGRGMQTERGVIEFD